MPMAKWSGWLTALSTAVLLAGIAHIFHLRFSRGDIFPPYSSLRADPMGTRALYESLQHLDDLEVKRDFRPFDRITVTPPVTLFIVGLAPVHGMAGRDPDEVSVARQAVAWAESGARVVIVLNPGPDDGEHAGQSGGDGRSAASEILFPNGARMTREESAAMAGMRAHRTPGAVADLPNDLPWYGPWHIERTNDAWTVIYERAGFPVMVEQRIAPRQGSLVIGTDAFALSNEALWRERETSYLAWLLGAAPRVVMVETHHGLREEAGIMRMIRDFRLHGILAGGLLLALFFIWRQRKPFPPPVPRLEATGTETGLRGRDAAGGLIALLKRAVPRRSLARVCLDVWLADRRPADRRIPAMEPRLRQSLDEAAKAGDSQPVALYHQLGHMIQERKMK